MMGDADRQEGKKEETGLRSNINERFVVKRRKTIDREISIKLNLFVLQDSILFFKNILLIFL